MAPPAPAIAARILGHYVEVVYTYPSLPSSPACRPFVLRATVLTRRLAPNARLGRVIPFPVNALVVETTGRFVVRMPFYGIEPFRLLVRTESILGRPGPVVEVPVGCPKPKGCRPVLPPWTRPPVTYGPLRGVGRQRLEASLRYVLSDSGTDAHCASIRSCTVTYTDLSFPHDRFKIRFRINSEQAAGCWFAEHSAVLDPPPYEDVTVRAPEAGCVSWVD